MVGGELGLNAVAQQLTPVDRAEQVRQVIQLIADGNSENKACALVGINRGTFRSAALRHTVADEYAQALATLAHDQINRIEDAIGDMREGTIDAGTARVEIDARKWFASKFLPKQYGDRQQIDVDAKVEVQQADPASIANQLVTLGTQYPTLNPVIRSLAQSILDRLPELPGA